MKYTDRAKEMSAKKGLLPRVELCARTGFSTGLGIGSVEDLVKGARECGISAIALCDEYSTAGYPKLFQSCKREEIDAIYGATIRIEKTRVAILAKNKKGVIAINKIISASLPENSMFKCSNKIEDLNPYRSDILSIGILSGNNDNLDFVINNFDYIGLGPLSKFPFSEKEKTLLSDHLDSIIVLSDSYYLNKADRLIHDALLRAHSDRYLNLKNGYDLKFTYPEEFVFNNPLNVLSKIEDDAYGDVLTCFDALNLISKEDFKDLVEEKIKNKEIFEKEEYKERLNIELEGILKNNYWNIVYLNYRIVESIKALGERCGFRGTMCNSLLNYALGITDVDPIKWKLPYETVYGYYVEKMPDFDINVSCEAKGKMFDIVESIVGKGNVIFPGTLEVMTDRQAARLINIHLDKGVYYDYETLENTKIFKLHDTVVNFGMHPGGYVVKSQESSFFEVTPVKALADNAFPQSINDFHSYHDHFIKQDILGYYFFDFAKKVEKLTGVKLEDVPFDDPKVLSLLENDAALNKKQIINEGANPFLGVNEFGTRFAYSVIKASKPKTVDDLVKVAGLSHGTEVWTGNNERLFEAGYSFDDIVANRDDIYNILQDKYGMSREHSYMVMEDVRKGRGVRPGLLAVLNEHNVPQYLIESMNRIKYMFPKGHSIEYVINALQMAYYKVYYPAEFYTALFNIKYEHHLKTVLSLNPDEFTKKVNENGFSEDELRMIENLYEVMERGLTFDYDESTGEATFRKE